MNPDHLEAVTGAVNSARSGSPAAINARRTHCVKDHEFTVENTMLMPGGHRRCRACEGINARVTRGEMKMVRVRVPVYQALAARAEGEGVSLTALVGSVLESFVASE